jgi:predicted metal-dependent peptidase
MSNSTSSNSGDLNGLHTAKPLELTAKQKQQWEDTMSMMMWVAPGFRHLFYKLLANNNGEHTAVMTDKVPVAATDAANILLNPNTFFEYSLPERTFIMCHEVVHNMLADVEFLHRCNNTGRVPMSDGTSMPFDNSSMQRAMDLRINAMLVESNIGKCPKDGQYDPKIATQMDSVVDIYKKIYEDNSGGGASGFDNLLPPGKSTGQNPQQAAAQRNPQQWAVEVAVAQSLMAQRAQGDMAGGLKRAFEKILSPEIPWTEHIKGIIHRKVGSGSYDWCRPDRRFIGRDLYLPSKSGYGANWVVCWGDTSGSRSGQEIASNMAELSGILEGVRPKRLTILWCDAAIDYIDELEDAGDLARVIARGTKGGGGTSCDPVFKWIHDNAYEPPDMFIGFTDGYVTFPRKEPPYPVIWASSTDKKDYPWGEVVRVNKINQDVP